ncbi:uncharacterized protein [Pyxicephalus adspersus]|uniref:uncharacterized protein n=1 Tax=Pyxicephalus adspersus TaxID=30357 RepID=UPI003B5A6E38
MYFIPKMKAENNLPQKKNKYIHLSHCLFLRSSLSSRATAIFQSPLHLQLRTQLEILDSEANSYMSWKIKIIGTQSGTDHVWLCCFSSFGSSSKLNIRTMSEVEKNAWLSFKAMVKDFLGNTQANIYREVVQKLSESFKMLGCNMSIKVHFLHSHLSNFLENLGAVSDEQGERFHQDLKVMEGRLQGRWDVHMMADYCWSIRQVCPNTEQSRKSYKRKFLP